jgi:hypothetical protein
MSDAFTPFAAFIKTCAEALDLPPQTVEHDRFMVQVEDRWVELRYSRDDDRVTFAAIVYVAPPDARLRADLISKFNLHYLFNGGLSLVQGDEGILYLCRPHQLSLLDSRHIRKDLVAFANTVAMAGTWYIRMDSEQPATLATLVSASDSEQILRI